ncbi:MAG: hypothetical protein M3P11_07945 [Actinomycetota bacterium]|nr:hypothetical protein [Actinomycetota bacterium]
MIPATPRVFAFLRPKVVAQLKRRARVSFVWLLVGFVSVLCFGSSLIYVARETASINAHAVVVIADVTDVSLSTILPGVTLRYAYEGELHETTVYPYNAAAYNPGDTVWLNVDREDPNRVTLGSDPNLPKYLLLLGDVSLVPVIAAPIGIALWVRKRKLYRILTRHPVRPVPIRSVSRFGFATLIGISDPPVVLRSATSLVWTANRSGIAATTWVEMAGEGAERVLVVPPGDRVLLVRRARFPFVRRYHEGIIGIR